MKFLILILLFLIPAPVLSIEKADLVIVIKSESTLYLKKNGNTVKKFNVVFGANPKGHKQMEGDERTPEGATGLITKKTVFVINQFTYPILIKKIEDGQRSWALILEGSS